GGGVWQGSGGGGWGGFGGGESDSGRGMMAAVVFRWCRRRGSGGWQRLWSGVMESGSARSNMRRIPNIVKPEIRTIAEIVPMADRTMEELLQAPTEGDVPNVAIKLMLLLYSLEDRAGICNIVPNPKGEMKAITTRSGLAYEGPSIPIDYPLEKVDEQNTEEILDKEHSNSSGSTAQVQPPVVPISIPEPDVPRTQTKPTIPYPSRLNDQKHRENATNQMEKFFQIFHDLHFDISFADALRLMQIFASTIKSLLANKDKLFELAKVPLNENCSAMLLKKLPEKLGDPELTPTQMTLELVDSRSKSSSNLREVLLENRSCFNRCIWRENYPQEVVQDKPKSNNPTLVSESDFCEDPIVKTSPFRESDFFSEEIEDFLNDDSIPTGIENSVYDPEGDILYFENLLKEDPFQLPPMNLNQAKSPIEELEYSFSMGYEHFITTPVTELDEVAESSAKNLVPIPSEYEVTSDNENEY
nr:hypothetical protein [Tanacetum cinerariifolium]